MATGKVIKLTNNNGTPLLPITDSAYVQHKWKQGETGGTTVTSVKDALNNVIDRFDDLRLSYDTTNGIVLTAPDSSTTNGEKHGNIKLQAGTNITLSYASQGSSLIIGTTANNYTHPSDGINASHGPTKENPKSTADTTLAHSDKFVIPWYTVNAAGHVTAGGAVTYALPAQYSHPTNGANKTVGPPSGKTLAHGDSFDVPKITINNLGHVTSASNITYTLPAQYSHPTPGVPNISNDPANKNVTGTTGVQEVITYVTVNNEGHVTSYGKTKIYSTDTNYYTTITNKPSASSGYRVLTVTNHSAGSTNGDYYISYASDTAGGVVIVDSSLSSSSTNPVQNKVIQSKLSEIETTISSGMHMRGTTSSVPATSGFTYMVGDSYIANGTITIASNYTQSGVAETVEAGDMITYVPGGKWAVVQNNLGVATSSKLGSVKSTTTGTTANRNYNVEVNSDGTMKVNVPWHDDNNNTYLKLTSSGSGNTVSSVTLSKESSGINTTYTLNIAYSSITSNVTSSLFVGAASSTGTAAVSSGTAYIHHKEGSSVNSKVGISGDGTWITGSYTANGDIKLSHAGPSTATETNGTLNANAVTQSTTTTTLTRGTSVVLTGVKFKKDDKGHITEISYSLGKMPASDNTNTQTQKLSGEYRSASNASYVKLSGDTPTEVGFYNTGGTTDAGITFSYTSGKGIGLTISYTHNVSKNIITTSAGGADAATANTTTFLKHLEGSTATSTHQITGANGIAVKHATGSPNVLTIYPTTKVSVVKTVSYTSGMYAVIGKDADLNDDWLANALGTTTGTTYIVNNVSAGSTQNVMSYT